MALVYRQNPLKDGQQVQVPIPPSYTVITQDIRKTKIRNNPSVLIQLRRRHKLLVIASRMNNRSSKGGSGQGE